MRKGEKRMGIMTHKGVVDHSNGNISSVYALYMKSEMVVRSLKVVMSQNSR